MLKKLISVIVPVYNVSPYLRECIDSILLQTYQMMEIILVDDGSTDGSGEICDEYATRDERIHVIHQTNQGVGAARNEGLAAAAGDYIGWVDSDDTINSKMYQRLVEAEADIAVCSFCKVSSNAIEPRNFGFSGTYSKPQIMDVIVKMDCGTILCNKLYRRELWEGLQFPRCRAFDDELISCSVLERAESLAVVDEIMYHYRMNQTSIMHSYRIEDGLTALSAACSRYNERKERDGARSVYCLVIVFCILRSCARVIDRRSCSEEMLNLKIRPAAALLAERRQELSACLGLGFLGQLEIAALSQGTYLSCFFSRLCQNLYRFRRGIQNVRKR